MPFTSGLGFGIMGPFDSIGAVLDSQDHPSLQFWAIQRDGGVVISEAAIIASSAAASCDEQAEPIQVSILVIEEVVSSGLFQGKTSDSDIQKSVNAELGDWVRKRPKETHAVCTTFNQNRSSQNYRGILLEKVELSPEETPSYGQSHSQYFVKIGHLAWKSNDINDLKSSKVNWVVL